MVRERREERGEEREEREERERETEERRERGGAWIDFSSCLLSRRRKKRTRWLFDFNFDNKAMLEKLSRLFPWMLGQDRCVTAQNEEEDAE